MTIMNHAKTPLALTLLTISLVAAACGGDGGDHGPGRVPGPPKPTTFTGNLTTMSELRSSDQSSGAAGRLRVRLASASLAVGESGRVEVCVENTGFCTVVDEDGFFTLSADVGGDVILVFVGPAFTARLPLTGVPPGSTVRIQDIRCDVTTGTCGADRVELTGPLANTSPICTGAEADPAILWPPNHELVSFAISGVSDADGDALEISATDIFQDEPVAGDGDGSGNTAPDAALDPPAVRAERSGQGNGRVYTVDFTAEDPFGGVCTGTVTICVPHDQGRGSRCVDDGPAHDSLPPPG